jgi:GNAT superfamily N-acetyltransferase
MNVRQIAADEWSRLRDIRLRALADAPSAFGSSLAREQDRTEADWRRWLETRDGVMFACVDEVEDAWVGIAGTYAEAEDPDLVWVVSMWVAPEARRRGAGRLLLGACVDWARARLAREVRLWVTEGNDAARTLYETAGFRSTGAAQPLPSDPTLEEMELSLGL